MLKEYMNYRCSMYYWLKSLYITEPSVEMLNDISRVCKEYKDIDDCPEFEGKFINFFENVENTLELHNEIKIEYARLFLGPKRPKASPYESVYTTARKQLFGESATEVKRMYEEMGVKIESKAHIPEDFIGYELEFMYYLSYFTEKFCNEKNIEKINELINYQKNFIETHLKNWIEDFTRDIIENTNMEFFKILGGFTKEFILYDYNNLSEMI